MVRTRLDPSNDLARPGGEVGSHVVTNRCGGDGRAVPLGNDMERGPEQPVENKEPAHSPLGAQTAGRLRRERPKERDT